MSHLPDDFRRAQAVFISTDYEPDDLLTIHLLAPHLSGKLVAITVDPPGQMTESHEAALKILGDQGCQPVRVRATDTVPQADLYIALRPPIQLLSKKPEFYNNSSLVIYGSFNLRTLMAKHRERITSLLSRGFLDVWVADKFHAFGPTGTSAFTPDNCRPLFASLPDSIEKAMLDWNEHIQGVCLKAATQNCRALVNPNSHSLDIGSDVIACHMGRIYIHRLEKEVSLLIKFLQDHYEGDPSAIAVIRNLIPLVTIWKYNGQQIVAADPLCALACLHSEVAAMFKPVCIEFDDAGNTQVARDGGGFPVFLTQGMTVESLAKFF